MLSSLYSQMSMTLTQTQKCLNQQYLMQFFTKIPKWCLVRFSDYYFQNSSMGPHLSNAYVLKFPYICITFAYAHRHPIQVDCLRDQPVCLVLSILSVALEKILAFKAGTSNDPAQLPCQPACLILFKQFVPTICALVGMDFLQTNMY